jgi:large subunit ribosomal protein L25
VRAGGLLEHITHEVTVEALPTDIPDSLKVDVSAMEIGDTVSLDTVETPEGVEILADEPAEVTIATCSPPRVSAEETGEVAAEPEVIGEEAAPAAEEPAEESGESAEE